MEPDSPSPVEDATNALAQESVLQTVEKFVMSIWQMLFQQWTLYQIAIIIICFVLATLIGKRLEPHIESRVREVKGNPGLLRVMAAMMRRVNWFLFVLFLWITLRILLATTWPSRSYFIDIALNLAAAWLVIAVLSRILRNRALSRIVAWCVWSIVALNILGLLGSTQAALQSLAVSVGDLRISVYQMVQGVFLVVGLTWLATLTGSFIENRIHLLDDLTPSLKVLLGKVIKILLVIIALFAALSGIGIDLTALTVFSGAVGVGLGFGLQKVVSNFISGIIILLDKSIKPGDTIALGDTFGWIRELRARFVSVITRDGREYLIPNEDFITQQVVNWSFSDTMIRLDVNFGVAYDSDPHQVTKLAIDSCATIPRVSHIKKPVCWITEFGDSSINFVLRFWISDPQNGLTNIRGAIYLALWDSFKENGITIPYPHRQVFVHNVPSDPKSDEKPEVATD